MIPAAYDWSGFYLGVNGGWGTANRCFDSISAAGTFIAADGCHDTSGAVAGAQMGYRWQMNSWVFGLEALGDWADLHGSSVSILNPAYTNRSRIDAFGLFTGQVGYAWNTTLLYLKGGAAVVADSNDILIWRRCRCNVFRRQPLGRHGRRWCGIQLRAELVGRRRVRPSVHRQQQHQLHGPSCQSAFWQRPHSRRCRYGHRSRQLPLGRPGGREVLIAI